MTTTSVSPPNRRGAKAATPPKIDPRIAKRRAAVAADANRSRQRQLLVALAVVAVGFVGFAVLQSPLFAVDRITISGQVSNPQAIVEASGVAIGSPLVNVDLAEARRSIAALPVVAQVSSRRDWNGEVVFDVVEREPVAQITTRDGSALLVDGSGRILARAQGVVDGAGPLKIVGLNPVDDGVALWVDDVAATAVQVAAAIPADVAGSTDHLEVTPFEYRLELSNGASVVLGEIATIDDQMRGLRTVLASIDQSCVVGIDLQNPDSPVIRRDASCA